MAIRIWSCSTIQEGISRLGMLAVSLLSLILIAQFTIGDFRTLVQKRNESYLDDNANPEKKIFGIQNERDPNVVDQESVRSQSGKPRNLDTVQLSQMTQSSHDEPLQTLDGNDKILGEVSCETERNSISDASHGTSGLTSMQDGEKPCRLRREGGRGCEEGRRREGERKNEGNGEESDDPLLLNGYNIERDENDKDSYYGIFVEAQPGFDSNNASISMAKGPQSSLSNQVTKVRKRSMGLSGKEKKEVKPPKQANLTDSADKAMKMADILVDAILGEAENFGFKSELGLEKKPQTPSPDSRKKTNLTGSIMKEISEVVSDITSRNCRSLTPDMSAFLQWILEGKSKGVLDLPGPDTPTKSPYEKMFYTDLLFNQGRMNREEKKPSESNKNIPTCNGTSATPLEAESNKKRPPKAYSPSGGGRRGRGLKVEETKDLEDALYDDSLKAYITSLLLFSGDDPDFPKGNKEERRRKRERLTSEQIKSRPVGKRLLNRREGMRKGLRKRKRRHWSSD